ncbi:hypothetical protein MNBD_GAMMA10-1296 [hydrothermal vent metagenome]|uniref:Autotransporter domain-containing protein n=1 Tax=hydrothermal vent metagenome TaxID=652676 RepID=A0A3B0XWF2_9ZZZZ
MCLWEPGWLRLQCQFERRLRSLLYRERYIQHTGQHTGYYPGLCITLAYASADIDAFSESGAQGFNLSVAEQSIESTTSKIGIQINKSISTFFGVILPEFAASWTHEFQADGEEIIAAFTIDPSNAFSFTTDERDSDFFIFSLATSLVLSHGVMGYIQYEKVFDIVDYDVSTLDIGVRIAF